MMHGRFSTLGLAFLSVSLLGACERQDTAAATHATTSAAAPLATAEPSKLPIANLSDGQLQERWNQLATSMSMEKMKLHNCTPAPAPTPQGQSITNCYSAARSMVYIVRTNGQVTQVQFASRLGMFSVSLAESARFMARFLHEGTSGDDVTLVNKFLQEAARTKRFCIPSAAVQSKMCYLTTDNSYGVEIR